MRRERFEGPGRAMWRIEVPVSRHERIRGLRDRAGLGRREGMLFMGCRSVHTFGMGFPILVAGLDRDMEVRRVWRLAPRRLIVPRACIRHIVECGADAKIVAGDRFIQVETGWSEV